jgi:hypothetical protein
MVHIPDFSKKPGFFVIILFLIQNAVGIQQFLLLPVLTLAKTLVLHNERKLQVFSWALY